MKPSKQIRRDAKQLFRSCQVNGLLDETRVRQLVKRVLETKPRAYLAVLSHFQRLVKLDMEQRSALVESATPLASDLQALLQAGLSRRYGSGLNFSAVHNPALIGGLRVKVGSDVYDGSIEAKLAALRESI